MKKIYILIFSFLFLLNSNFCLANEDWAEMAIKTADLGASLLRRGTSGENVLKIITSGIIKANNLEAGEKCTKTGILRINREGWKSQISEAMTEYIIPRYKSYATRIRKVIKAPLEAPEKKLAITRPDTKYPELIHGEPLYINNSLFSTKNNVDFFYPHYPQIIF